jgi:predicted CXXCH cytochrome family protein
MFGVLLGVTISGRGNAAAAAKAPGFNKCLECHRGVEKELHEKGVHAPFKSMACSSCHNPHAAKHENLVKEDISILCRRCHDKEKTLQARKHSHPPFGAGECLSCHKPHASKAGNLLKETGEKLCFGCHAREAGFTKKNAHAPLKKGECLSCHSAHTSDHNGLIKKDRKTLCAACHSVAGAKAQKAHLGYAVQGTDCMSCHSPHGSDRKGLVKGTLHKPFAQKKCRTCHQGLDSGTPLGLKTTGASLCIGCHETTQDDFQKTNSHVGSGAYCANCHSPHASDDASLMKGKESAVCFACHGDTKAFMARKDAAFKHPSVKEGQCTPCHRPHGSDRTLFFADEEFKVCTACHERHATFTHPIGEKAIDPRSKRDITCITCHNLMGSPYEFALRFDRRKQLCIQCHKGY